LKSNAALLRFIRKELKKLDLQESLFESIVLAKLLGRYLAIRHIEDKRNQHFADESEFDIPSAFEAAVRFFFERGVIRKDEFEKLSKDIRRQVFTLAADSRLHVLNQVKEMLQSYLETGGVIEDFINDIDSFFARAGVAKQSTWYWNVVFQNNIQEALARGKDEIYDAASEDEFPYRQFLTVGDDRVRPSHAELDGFTAPKNDKIWDVLRVPLDHGCRCSITLVHKDETDVLPTNLDRCLIIGGVKFSAPVRTHFADNEECLKLEGPGFGFVDKRSKHRKKGADVPAPAQVMDKQTLEKDLTSGQIKKKEGAGDKSGVNETLFTSNGVQGVFKPAAGEKDGLRMSIPGGTYYKREVAAYELDKVLGIDLVPPTVIRKMDGRIGSHQLFMNGYKTWDEAPDAWKAKISNETKERMQLLDYLLGNEDRHVGNFMINESGNMVAIDNGLTFGIDFAHMPRSFFEDPYKVLNAFEAKGTASIVKNMEYRHIEMLKQRLFDSGLLEEGAFKSLLSRIKNMLENNGNLLGALGTSSDFEDISLDEALKIIKEML
jgi:SPP1 gp7 family putative phage head morphogenesis protein